MLRIVIQVSMFLAIPLMGWFLYIQPWQAPWYVSYVLLFTILIAPVFSADRVTGERERQTLDLLLTTTLSPWKILWGKLLAGLWVSTVLTMLIACWLGLACLFVPDFWPNLPTMLAYLLIVLVTCLTTSSVAFCCSVLCPRTSISLMVGYLVILPIFLLPPAVKYFVDRFAAARMQAVVVERVPESAAAGSGQPTGLDRERGLAKPERVARARAAQRLAQVVHYGNLTSPFAAAHALPLEIERQATSGESGLSERAGGWGLFWLHLAWSLLLNSTLLAFLIWLLNTRWRVAQAEG
ncbi:MAG: ABC transporter permease subunit [Planctomycetales bacterium]|nr:ABC transporter permease subunit [Planctomycetales bacterium]